MTVMFRSGLGRPGMLLEGTEDVIARSEQCEPLGVYSLAPREPGWYLISSYQMTMDANRYFSKRVPVAQPFPDILLFHIDAKER